MPDEMTLPASSTGAGDTPAAPPASSPPGDGAREGGPPTESHAPAAPTAPGGQSPQAAAEPGQGAEAAPDEKLPWHADPRFQKFLAEKKELESFRDRATKADPVLDQIRQEAAQFGVEVKDWDDVPKAQAAAGERQRQALEAQQEQQQQAQLAQRLQSQVDAGELDQDTANERYRYEVANQRLYRIEMGGAVQAALQQFPHADVALIQHLARDPQAVQQLAAHTHARVAELEARHAQALQAEGARAVSEYAAAQAQRQAQPAPEGSGNGGGAPPPAPARAGSWRDLFAAGR